MRLLIRLGCILAGACAIAYGVDGLGINTVPKSFTIEEVESRGVGDTRFVIVTGAESNGEHIAVQAYRPLDSSQKSTIGAIIPLFSRHRLAQNAGSAQIGTSVLYSLEGTNGCLMNKTCGQPTTVYVRGVVKRGDWWGVGASYSDSNYPHAPNFIFVAEGEPLPEAVYLLIILSGGIFLLLGFLPKHLFSKYVTGTRR